MRFFQKYDIPHVTTTAPSTVYIITTSLTLAISNAILQTFNCRLWCACFKFVCVYACRHAFVYDHQDMPKKIKIKMVVFREFRVVAFHHTNMSSR